MIKSRLLVGGVNFGFTQELPVSTNMSIADIREPDKRQGAFSKTLVIPGSGEVKRVFEFIFQINSSLSSFNPNIKTPAKYYVNEVLVFDGSLQLLKINNTFLNDYESTTFECSLIGENGNLFLDIAGLYLTDIDLSDLDHTFTYTSSMFSPATLGTGYCYPYIDYGLNTSGAELSSTWAFRWLKPAVFKREYMSRIFKYAGYYYDGANYVNSSGDVWSTDSYSWEASGYFDTDYAKRIIIPDVNQGQLKMTVAQRLQNEVYIGRTVDYSQSPMTGTYGGAGMAFSWYFENNNISLINPVPFNNEAAPYYDANSRWDSVTNFRFNTYQEGDYTLYCNLDIALVIDTYPAGAVTYEAPSGAYEVQIEFQKSTDGGSTWTNLGNFPHQFNFATSVSTPTNTSLSAALSAYLVSGNLIRVALVQGSLNLIQFKDGGGSILTAGTASAHFDVKVGSVVNFRMTGMNLQEGQTVVMNQTIPTNVTQLDFFTSIIKLEHLYIEPSKTIKNQYVIKTRDQFIETEGNNALDWTDKWDISKPQEVIPMGELDFNRLLFSYKSDKDFYNKTYEEKYKEVYGSQIIDTENEFIKRDKKIDVVFSATPIVGTNINDIVAPRFLDKDKTTNVVSPLKCNIRYLYWGGLKTCNEHQFITGSSINYRTTYPFCGHVDDAINPTLDLSWDNPYELNWFYPGRTYTNNNRYNERYSQFIEEITDKDSKIVKMWFYLTETDIAKFSFSNLVFVRDSYYLVNKIIDYNPQVKTVTQVELLKLKAGPVFVPDNDLDIENLGDGGIGISDRVFNNNNGTGLLLGTGNVNNGFGTLVIGNDNVIG
jgi:hypothetical protein